MQKPSLRQRLQLRQVDYLRLRQGADGLLETAGLAWTERLLLRLVRWLAGRRLEELRALLPRPVEEDGPLQENMMEVMVSAAMDGHDLGPWEAVEGKSGGYQARCARCDRTVYVSDRTVYSLLEETCA